MAGDITKATPDELAQVADFSRFVRSIMIDLAKIANRVDAAMSAWDANILGIIGPPNNVVIQDDNGLAGAALMTDTQLTNLVGYMTTLKQAYETLDAQAAIVLAVGPTNTIG